MEEDLFIFTFSHNKKTKLLNWRTSTRRGLTNLVYGQRTAFEVLFYSGLPDACERKRPNTVLKEAKFWILLNKLLGKKGQTLNKPRLEKKANYLINSRKFWGQPFKKRPNLSYLASKRPTLDFYSLGAPLIDSDGPSSDAGLAVHGPGQVRLCHEPYRRQGCPVGLFAAKIDKFGLF